MNDDLSSADLKKAVGKKIEVLAFGIVYRGRLKQVNLKEGTIRIEDKGDYAILEIERLESLRVLDR